MPSSFDIILLLITIFLLWKFFLKKKGLPVAKGKGLMGLFGGMDYFGEDPINFFRESKLKVKKKKKKKYYEKNIFLYI